MTRKIGFFISCEHGGNQVPDAYRHLFKDHRDLLNSHRGYDIGILPFAERLAAHLGAPFLFSPVTRLLVDMNRSLGSRSLFSELTRNLPEADRRHLLHSYHQPYWTAAKDIISGIVTQGRRTLHLSVHSFTPVFNGQCRNADLGLLYDSRRTAEKSLCLQWQNALKVICPELRVRRNYPYHGNADALVTALRKHYSANDYLGIELEINQGLPLTAPARWQALQEQLLATIGA